MDCKECGTELTYNAELTHDPTFESDGVRWYYCSKCNMNYPSEIRKAVYLDRNFILRSKRL